MGFNTFASIPFALKNAQGITMLLPNSFNFKKAKNDLELGLDNVVDDITLEINLTIQLGEAYNGLGDAKKKDFYFSKANELLKKAKK